MIDFYESISCCTGPSFKIRKHNLNQNVSCFFLLCLLFHSPWRLFGLMGSSNKVRHVLYWSGSSELHHTLFYCECPPISQLTQNLTSRSSRKCAETREAEESMLDKDTLWLGQELKSGSWWGPSVLSVPHYPLHFNTHRAVFPVMAAKGKRPACRPKCRFGKLYLRKNKIIQKKIWIWMKQFDEVLAKDK